MDLAATNDNDHPGFLTTKKEIRAWIKENCKIDGSYAIMRDGKVVVTGNLDIKTGDTLTHIAVEFDSVSGYCSLFGCTVLKSLKGAPATVSGYFSCAACTALTTLAGGPSYVGDYSCGSCKNLIDFTGAPLQINGVSYWHDLPHLKTFNGFPATCYGRVDCSYIASEVDLRGLPKLSQPLLLSNIPDPRAANTRILLQQRICIDDNFLDSKDKTLVDFINEYHKSGDLFTAIDQFEAYFQEPFYDTMIPASIMDMPSL